MAIVASDILIKHSIKTASAGDADSQGDPNASLGKFMSSSQVTSATLHALFDVISGAENAASVVDYRCIFVQNNHATLTLQDAVVYVSSEVSGGANIAIGLDTTAISDHDSGTQQALEVANETTAPSGVSFSTPTTFETGLSIGDLAPGKVKAIWIRRTATNSAAQANDGATLTITGDTAA